MCRAKLHISIFGFWAAFSIIALRSALMPDALVGYDAQRGEFSAEVPGPLRKGIVH
jgi:hypothetical protein